MRRRLLAGWLGWVVSTDGATLCQLVPSFFLSLSICRKGDQYLFTLDMWATDLARWVRGSGLRTCIAPFASQSASQPVTLMMDLTACP